MTSEEELRSKLLAAALESQDAVAVAFAIRNEHTIVPLLPVDGPPQIRVFRRTEAVAKSGGITRT